MESGSFPTLTWCISERIAWKCNNLCISMLFMMAFAGVQVRRWQKGCTMNVVNPYNCNGAYDTPVCKYTFLSGIISGNCIQCCEGDQCNTGDPPRPDVGALQNAPTCPPPNATTCAPLIAATYAAARISAGGTLAALSPIVLSLFSFFVFFLLK